MNLLLPVISYFRYGCHLADVHLLNVQDFKLLFGDVVIDSNPDGALLISSVTKPIAGIH